MKLTKYQHSCFLVEEGETTLLVDPGVYSKDFIAPKHLDAIFVSHEHGDHLNGALIEGLLARWPNAILIAPEAVLGGFSAHTTAVARPGATMTVGTLTLRFFGGTHATALESATPPQNSAVLINDRLYFPGDSFVTPGGIVVKELALPLCAPWSKVQETTDFLIAVHPSFVFPVHDAILSEDGKAVYDNFAASAAASIGAQYKRLDGASIELA